MIDLKGSFYSYPTSTTQTIPSSSFQGRRLATMTMLDSHPNTLPHLVVAALKEARDLHTSQSKKSQSGSSTNQPAKQARAQAGLSTGNVSSVPKLPLKSSTKFSCSTKLLQSFYNSRSLWCSSEDFAGESATEKLPAAISDPQSSSTKFQRSISSTKFFIDPFHALPPPTIMRGRLLRIIFLRLLSTIITASQRIPVSVQRIQRIIRFQRSHGPSAIQYW